MQKNKSFLLDSGSILGWTWGIRLRIYPDGTFYSQGWIDICNHKKIQEKYRSSHREEDRERTREYYKNNTEARMKKSRDYYANNKEECLKRIEKWKEDNPENWREICQKSNSKRRELGHHKISFPLEVEFDWHHVNKNDIVAFPRDIHQNISHKLGENDLEGVLG
ncbi:MAG: hypothetical protein KAX49_16605 [Halanaerobiales bacterium]|nr:hypothetical protein [Halanaerobiales bacterium]